MSRRGSHIETIGHVDANTVTLEDSVLRKASVANPEFAALNQEAHAGTTQEHQMGFMQAIKLYPKAVAWSMLLSTALVMEGYDTNLLANFYALDTFQKRYGVLQSDGTYVITASWRSGLNNGANCGEILGLWVAGLVHNRFGYKKTLIGALILMICFIFLTFFANGLPMLLIGEILCGIPWGVFQTLTTAYASDVTPVALRAYLTTYVNLCWVMGQFISSGVLRALLTRTDQWSYRIPFALEWMWPVPILVGACFAPESPYWLVQKGRIEDARHSLLRLTTRNDPTFDPDKTIAMMEHTNEIEKEIDAGTSYFDCLRGVNLRRTEIVVCVWAIQQWVGSQFMGYSTTFYERAGLPATDSFDMSMAQYALGAIGTMGSWWLMGYCGRRTLYVFGSCILTTLLLIIGFLGIAPKSDHGASWAIGSLLLIFTFTYDITVGPVCYSLVAEIPSTRLKAKTIIISRNIYNICGIITNILINYQLTTTAWNWAAKSGFFWAGTCALCAVYSYFRVPEPKNKTYGELDVLFERGVSARKFKRANVDMFRSDNLAVIESNGEGEKMAEKMDAQHYEEKV